MAGGSSAAVDASNTRAFGESQPSEASSTVSASGASPPGMSDETVRVDAEPSSTMLAGTVR